MTKANNTVKKGLKQNIIKNIKIYIFLCASVVLISCSNSNPKKPDNKLKKSPCACVDVIYDSRIVSS